MRNFKLVVEYNGENFFGWARQPGLRCVETALADAIFRFTKKKVKIIGSGRTDAGVHAVSQVVSFKLATKKSLEEIKSALNGNVPKDIKVRAIFEETSGFHARFSAKSRTYVYHILNGSHMPLYLEKFAYHVRKKLDIRQMRRAAFLMKGRHDFASFANCDKGQKNTVRNILQIKISCRKMPAFFSLPKKEKGLALISITVKANAFLYRMVRNIVGVLLAVGEKKLTPQKVLEILGYKDRRRALRAVPAKGLCLVDVEY